MSAAAFARVAVFASGSGTNAEALIRHQLSNSDGCYRVVLIITNKREAGVVEVARKHGVDFVVIEENAGDELSSEVRMLHTLEHYSIDLVCLAGYLKKIPPTITQPYHNRILNIHPSLLPKYGGKGMYGRKVFEAVLSSHETTTGVTIHWINDEYDAGDIVAQRTFVLDPMETLESLMQRTRMIEHVLYPEVLEKVAKELLIGSLDLKRSVKKENL